MFSGDNLPNDNCTTSNLVEKVQSAFITFIVLELLVFLFRDFESRNIGSVYTTVNLSMEVIFESPDTQTFPMVTGAKVLCL